MRIDLVLARFLVMLMAVCWVPTGVAKITLNPLKNGFVKNYQSTCLQRSDHNPNKQKIICQCEALAMYDEFTWDELEHMASAMENGRGLARVNQQRVASVVRNCQSSHSRQIPRRHSQPSS